MLVNPGPHFHFFTFTTRPFFDSYHTETFRKLFLFANNSDLDSEFSDVDVDGVSVSRDDLEHWLEESDVDPVLVQTKLDSTFCCVIYCHSTVFMVQATRLCNLICNTSCLPPHTLTEYIVVRLLRSTKAGPMIQCTRQKPRFRDGVDFHDTHETRSVTGVYVSKSHRHAKWGSRWTNT